MKKNAKTKKIPDNSKIQKVKKAQKPRNKLKIQKFKNRKNQGKFWKFKNSKTATNTKTKKIAGAVRTYTCVHTNINNILIFTIIYVYIHTYIYIFTYLHIHIYILQQFKGVPAKAADSLKTVKQSRSAKSSKVAGTFTPYTCTHTHTQICILIGVHTHINIYIHTHFNSSKGYKPQQKVLADEIRHSHKWLQVAALGFHLGLPAGSWC